MKRNLSILLLEDVVADAVLINHELQRGGLQATANRVETREEFLNTLEQNPPDVILSDHGLPTFDGFTALREVKQRRPDIPFIFVAQASGAEEVIRSYKSGASDFVLKSQIAAQLVPAIRNALARTRQVGAEQKIPVQEHFQAFMESHPELGLFLMNAEGKILSWNVGAEKITGLKPKGGSFSDLFFPEDVQNGWPKQLIASALEHGHVTEESARLRKPGGEFWATLWIHALPHGDAQADVQAEPSNTPANATDENRILCVTMRDISHVQGASAEANRLLAGAEQRCRQRTAELDAANKELDAFSYSVSHDLRAPLRHIDGFVEMLQNRLQATLDDSSREYLGIITTAAKQMGQLIEALLSFSRTSRAPLYKSHVAVDKLVQSVVRDLRFETEGREVEWVISPLPTVDGDSTLLRQVLFNLVSNALKFTKPRPKARIEIGDMSNEFESVIFVRDNGVGFDMQYSGKLFGVFQRLHSATDFPGSGIGLANARRIIQRHGGRVLAEASSDAGATFYFSLPRSTESSASRP